MVKVCGFVLLSKKIYFVQIHSTEASFEGYYVLKPLFALWWVNSKLVLSFLSARMA